MAAREQIEQLEVAIGHSIIGQREVIRRLIIGLLANGNLLVEGLPGLAKTRAIKSLAKNLEADFSRIQFTPDLLPADVTGTDMLYRDEHKSEFRFHPGPIFANIVLADEINRAPAKVQSALLEAMEERQVTVAGKTHKMPPLFMVMATQNPIEQEGTYPLPEAQMDRFLMHVLMTYPPVKDEVSVIELVRGEEIAAAGASATGPTAMPAEPATGSTVIPQQAVFDARREIAAIHVSDAMGRYMADLVEASRHPANYSDELARWIEIGASPRGSIALDKCGRTNAWLEGRDYVDPQDIHAVIHDCLRHRLGLSFEAQGEGISTDRVIDQLLEQVALP
ncbi:AAA family ATPase [Microbulbifer hydrolyticus]|uniref:AAA domain-containing protein n=1 Tax=Microbulbifer hydrolyticus TaxID=48074 RepID=A0A6P1TAN8_9GAMM|nr:MoxR family ATPase [Microbulbifer hydrolyticus]MBB5210846.1 MoxR-like ATPase [Microbulbifer hydrolyticus]QHQ38723.1 AAA domain-containing protein [Microbulbifer hydrolyticus]